MKKHEFLDLLRFYLEPLPKTVAKEIVEEYRAHFEEGIAHGKTEEEISRELGSPGEIAKEYLYDEGESPDRFKTGLFRTQDGALNGAMIVLAILLSPIWCSLLLAGFSVLFALVVTLVVVPASFIFAGIVVLVAAFFPSLPWVHAGGMVVLLHPITRVLLALTIFVLGLVLMKLVLTLFAWGSGKIKEAYGTYQWKRSRS